jgi:hypothetical protein
MELRLELRLFQDKFWILFNNVAVISSPYAEDNTISLSCIVILATHLTTIFLTFFCEELVILLKTNSKSH